MKYEDNFKEVPEVLDFMKKELVQEDYNILRNELKVSVIKLVTKLMVSYNFSKEEVDKCTFVTNGVEVRVKIPKEVLDQH